MVTILTVYFVVFAVSYGGVELFRRWSLKREMLDFPNERSSHSVPTPRGGGLLVCAVSILTFLIYVFLTGEIIFWSYFVGAGLVSLVSLVDDIKPLSPFLRIFFHGLASGLTVWSFGGFEWVLVPLYGIVYLGFVGDVLAFLWIVWLINAYNFMDGIDGIAATQSVTAAGGWLLTGLFFGIDSISFYAGVLGFSSLGFLILNWQPAKIFMGDVGSAFLGFSFAVIPLMAIRKIESPTAESIVPWIAIFLVWFFVFDSVFTFLKRLFRGAKVWHPHREHIYQKMVIGGWSHWKVTTVYGLASIGLVLALGITLYKSWSFEKAFISTVLVETLLLIFIWQAVVRGGKQSKVE